LSRKTSKELTAMSTIVKEDDLTFKDIEKEIYKYVCQLAIGFTQLFLETYDQVLMKERDKSLYRHKGYKEDHIRCVYGDVPFSRVVYETVDDDGKKKCICLLDQVLKMDSVGKMSMNLVEEIVANTSKMSFRNAAEEINRSTNAAITFQSAWNVVQKLGDSLEKEETALVDKYKADQLRDGREVPVLFEEADGVYLHLQGKDRPKKGSGKEIKVSVAYEGWKPDGSLIGRVMSAGYEDGRKFQQIREAMINQVYNTDEIKLRVMNGDGADWVRETEDPATLFQLDAFHVYQKILRCISDKEMQKDIRRLYDENQVEDLLDKVDTYANSIATNEGDNRGERKARELYDYLNNNREYLVSYSRRKGVMVPEAPAGVEYRNLGTQENHNCSSITLRMKHRKCSWSIAGANHMAKILVRFANRTIWSDIKRCSDSITEEDCRPYVWEILSAAKAPRFDGIKGPVGNVMAGHVCYRDAEMTFSRKAFLKVFDNKNFSSLIYR
jgi:hypothetical protein